MLVYQLLINVLGHQTYVHRYTLVTHSKQPERVYTRRELYQLIVVVWSVITADNFTPAKRDESFSATFTEP